MLPLCFSFFSRILNIYYVCLTQVLHANGFPVPTPIDQSRHCIIMSLVDGFPLRQVAEHPNPGKLYSQLMALLVRFARAGLIHGDFNEFNILIRDEDGEPVVIDFPQLVSTNHKDAEWLVLLSFASSLRTWFLWLLSLFLSCSNRKANPKF